jgi:signal transduction histidine kinase
MTRTETSTEFRSGGISQQSFRALIENVADGVLVVDRNGRVLYANPAAAEILGHTREELVLAALGRPSVSGETTEITVPRPGRGPAQVEMRVVELTWDGKPALLASLRDVSLQRARDERLRQSQKLEAIGRLAAGVTHDFNNLLAVIEAGLRLLQKRLADLHSDPKVDALMEELLNRTSNGGALTQQLLAFSRQQSLTPRSVNLNARIRSLAGMLQHTLGRGISIETKLDESLGPVSVDANQLDVAILNLAVNARDAMSGRGTLTIETSKQDAPLDCAELPSRPVARITVRDTGCGMSKELCARVFEPFFTTKEDGRGTGLGLSQVYGFVTQSGGQVMIDSEIGKGTSVHVLLPRVAAPEEARFDNAPPDMVHTSS